MLFCNCIYGIHIFVITLSSVLTDDLSYIAEVGLISLALMFCSDVFLALMFSWVGLFLIILIVDSLYR